MHWRFSAIENGMKIDRYWSSHCPRCAIKEKCTPSDYRRVSRWEHQAVLDDMQTRLDRAADSMRIRRQTVEHPFGTIKSWMGSAHFLTKTLKRVSTEMSLHVLAYNLKRVMQILGPVPLMQMMRGVIPLIAVSIPAPIHLVSSHFAEQDAHHRLSTLNRLSNRRSDDSSKIRQFLHSLGHEGALGKSLHSRRAIQGPLHTGHSIVAADFTG